MAKRGPPVSYSAEEVVEAAYQNGGVILRMAEALGVSRRTIYDYRKRWKTVDAAISDAREGILDLAETKLVDALEEGDMRAVTFTLARLGKDRGWVERQEIAAIAQGDVQIERTVVDAPDLALPEGNEE